MGEGGSVYYIARIHTRPTFKTRTATYYYTYYGKRNQAHTAQRAHRAPLQFRTAWVEKWEINISFRSSHWRACEPTLTCLGIFAGLIMEN